MQPRLVALFALAFVLYVVASVGAAGMTLDPGVLALALVACASALTPLWLRQKRDLAPGGSLVGMLGITQALGLAAYVSRAAHVLLGELLGALMLPAVALMVLRLALRVPDLPPRLARGLPLGPVCGLVAGAGAVLGAFAALPPIQVGQRVLIVPHVWSLGPLVSTLGCFGAALGLRLLRRRLGSDAHALAANLWATVGSVSAALVLALAWLAEARLARAMPALLALSAALLLTGHVWTVAPARVRVASAWSRELLTGALAASVALALAWLVAPRAGDALPWLVPATVITFLLTRRQLRPWVVRVLGPSGGRLLEAIDEAQREAPFAEDYADRAARVLRPLRRATGLPEAVPRLYTLDPPRVVQLDAAGLGRVSEQAMPSALLEQLSRRLGEPIVRTELATLSRRRPELGAVVRVLDELDALCVLPLIVSGELEGALVIARGARRDPVTLEELLALERLSLALAPMVSASLALERARLRADSVGSERITLVSRIEEQENELGELRAHTVTVKAALGLTLPERDAVQYSGVMRELAGTLERVAPHDVPLLLWGETGLALSPLAQLVHRASGRAEAPLVLFDGASLDAEAALARLFGVGRGSAAQPGLLALIGRGTLVVTELPALAPRVQLALAQVLEEKRASVLRSSVSHRFEGRLIATARRAPHELGASQAIVPELLRWFSATSHRVPPLRERPEDLESLLLLALDRAARVLGVSTKGVEAEALKALIAYDWPGNDEELGSVIERAVRRAEGARITYADLPSLPLGPVLPTSGSYAEQEREILRRALRHAGGDRTRAARALGLRRTTLVEKLRELGVDDPTSAEN